MSWDYKSVNMESLIGLTFTNIERSPITAEDDEIIFTTADGRKFKMYHSQDCCESVRIEDIAGNLEDLIGSPILMSEESTNEGKVDNREYADSCTWTFYKFATVKGYVTIRWYGTSNGYYSERANLVEWRNESTD